MTVEVGVTATLRVPVQRVWEVVQRTDRYAEWVDGVVEVTDHHAEAVVGGVYREINRTVGPLRTRSTWRVDEIVPQQRRVDSGSGFAPLHDMVNVFTFAPTVDGGTSMTYAVRYRPGLGPLGHLIDRLQRPALRRAFARSMRALEDLVVAEDALESSP